MGASGWASRMKTLTRQLHGSPAGAATCLFAVLELEIRKRTCSMALLTRGSFWSMEGCTTRSTCGNSGVPKGGWGRGKGAQAPQLTPVLIIIPKRALRGRQVFAEHLLLFSGINIPQVIKLCH